jgi:hypothetical protein
MYAILANAHTESAAAATHDSQIFIKTRVRPAAKAGSGMRRSARHSIISLSFASSHVC